MAKAGTIEDAAARVMALSKDIGVTLVVAESCTAGLLDKVLSDAPGAAQHFHGGFVAYTKQQKTRALGVPAELLKARGAVCAEVARLMAEGALRSSPADVALAITGVAGPEPDEDGNPVGLVWIAVASRGGKARDLERRYGNIGREAVRRLLSQAFRRPSIAGSRR
jgi:nicotinamide-nucleotide amidase